jgi:phospholipase/carboxylesterase
MAELVGLRWGPASKGTARQLVVLCHGVGADAHDLIDLAPTWSHALPDALFVAPDAPQPYDQGPSGRQWFSLQDRTPAVLDAAARHAAPSLLAYVDAELAQAGLPPDAVAMMGFSQGAMMVLHAGLRRRPPPRGITAYSGALLDTAGLAGECTGHPPVLLVHGQQDDVVPFARAAAAESALVRLGMPVQTLWCPNLGHGIDDAGLSAGALFLQRLFA